MADITDDTRTITVALVATGSITAAKGKLVSVNAPTHSAYRQYIKISAQIQNVGGTTGRFKLKVSGGGKIAASSTITVAKGALTPTLTLTMYTPSTGTSVTYTVSAIRVT